MVNAPAVTSRIEIGMDIIDQLLETSPDNPNLEGQIEEHLNALAEPPRTRFNLDNLEKASMVTKSFRNPHLKMSRPNFSSDKDRVLTYELVVAILKYSSFLKDALVKTRFYDKYPEIKNYPEEAVMVVFYDLLERGFRTHPLDLEIFQEIFLDIHNALISHRTKLMAYMARLRIRHESRVVESYDPTNANPIQPLNMDKNPLYAWVNLRKISTNEVVFILKHQGLVQKQHEDDVLIEENSFCVDKNHSNLLRIHSRQAEKIRNLNLIADGKLIIQDKSACIFVYAIVRALYLKEAMTGAKSGAPLIGGESSKDSAVTSVESGIGNKPWYEGILDGFGKNYSRPDFVIITHCGFGRSAAHLAMLLSEAVPRHLTKNTDMSTCGDLCKAISSKFVSRPPLIVYAFGCPADRIPEVAQFFKKTIGVTNFKIFTDDFLDLEKNDPRIRGAAAIIVNPPSSGSALKDPVAYICAEGGDDSLLTQLAKYANYPISEEGYKSYTAEQVNCLKMALSFEHVRLIMYTTCSTMECENWGVLQSALFHARQEEESKKMEVLREIVDGSPVQYFREAALEVVDLRKVLNGYPETSFAGRVLETKPSSASSGVFLALLRRRDRIIKLSGNPIKNFIASQVAFRTDPLELLPVFTPDAAVPAPSKNLDSETDWLNFIKTRYNMDFTESQQKSYNSHVVNYSTLATVAIPFPKSSYNLTRNKLSRKAIVQRIAAPTFASLAKIRPKILPEAGTEVLTRTSSVNSSASSSEQKDSCPLSAGSCSKRKPGNSSSRPDSALSTGSCVCSRHAKKFPEYDKQSSKKSK